MGFEAQLRHKDVQTSAIRAGATASPRRCITLARLTIDLDNDVTTQSRNREGPIRFCGEITVISSRYWMKIGQGGGARSGQTRRNQGCTTSSSCSSIGTTAYNDGPRAQRRMAREAGHAKTPPAQNVPRLRRRPRKRCAGRSSIPANSCGGDSRDCVVPCSSHDESCHARRDKRAWRSRNPSIVGVARS